MAKMEMRFALHKSSLRIKADREGVIEHEARISCSMRGAKIESEEGDDRRFTVVISHSDAKVLQEIMESSRRSLAGSGVMLNDKVY